MNKSTRQLAAWIASFAMLLAALAPSISHAVSVAKGGKTAWLEICTVSGIKVMSVADDQSPTSTSSEKGMQAEHCPFCSPHSGSVGLLPTAVFELPLIAGMDSSPALFYQSSRPLFAWSAAQPRAPPSFS